MRVESEFKPWIVELIARPLVALFFARILIAKRKLFPYRNRSLVSVLDASGNYAGGMYYGQYQRASHPNQCYQLNDELNYLISRDINSSNLLNTSSVVPFFVQLVSSKYTTYVDSVVS